MSGARALFVAHASFPRSLRGVPRFRPFCQGDCNTSGLKKGPKNSYQCYFCGSDIIRGDWAPKRATLTMQAPIFWNPTTHGLKKDQFGEGWSFKGSFTGSFTGSFRGSFKGSL